MIEIKSEREIALLKEAGRIVALCHEEMKKQVRPGVSTQELNDICERIILEHNATPSFKGYGGFPSAVCASVNEVVVHGIPSKKQILKEGDIVALDIGACYKGYHGDSAWSYAVGNISSKDKLLMQVTHDALFKGLEQVHEGAHLGDVSAAIGNYASSFGFGIVEEFTGHGVGRNLHEDPAIFNFGEPGTGPLLKEGMVLAIEPMINAGTKKVRILSDGWTTVTKDKSKSAHFEHTIVVRKNGYEILTTL
ncbi:MAG: type I methionyl aminopeptidase [Acholeplasmatales bacterium]|jgi:methionyl aminopeptidase|nr:type I methionyl aminopeptidase [Acholeplasmatales bacterium]MCI9654007.1 type I methionyl aminopeptidase [Acholeplasmatales bacterium]